jgi:phosphate transport system protein
MSEGSHILGNFERALNKLSDDLIEMGSQVEHSFQTAVRGLMRRDSDLCNQVLADDEEIDQFEIDIDKDGMQIIALYNPVATDLRKVVSAMKVSSNLERIADQAVGIAKRARKMNKNAEVPETRLVEPIYELAASLLHDAISGFSSSEGNVDEAIAIQTRDKEIDAAYKETAKILTARMEEDPAHIKDYLDLQFIIRFIERIGDHAKNIAQDNVYAESAVDIRHGGDLPEGS